MKVFFLIVAFIFVFAGISAQNQNINELAFGGSMFYFESKIYTGSYTSFYKNGKVHEVGFIINGKKDSIVSKYDKKGFKKSISLLKKGEVYHQTLFYPKSNKIKRKISIKNGKEDGVCVSYYINGHVQDSGYIENGKRKGNWTYWKNDGRKDYETIINADSWGRKDYVYTEDSIYTVSKLFNKYGREIKK